MAKNDLSFIGINSSHQTQLELLTKLFNRLNTDFSPLVQSEFAMLDIHGCQAKVPDIQQIRKFHT